VNLLLDECVPNRLRYSLSGHNVKSASEMGWTGLKNGALLAKVENSFDVFITVDRNLSFQQNIPKLRIAVLLLRAQSNELSALQPLVPKMLSALPTLKPGTVTVIESE
jgi:hypothetical protein